MNITVVDYELFNDTFKIALNDERFTVQIEDDALISIESARADEEVFSDALTMNEISKHEAQIVAACVDYFEKHVNAE